jgi:hypothetical protein
MCELDKEIFTCNRCKKQFKHTEGTWLPVGYDYSHQKIETEFIGNNPIRAMNSPDSHFFLREPEIVTSDEFTCYGCLKEGDGDGFLEEDMEDNAYHLDATNY